MIAISNANNPNMAANKYETKDQIFMSQTENDERIIFFVVLVSYQCFQNLETSVPYSLRKMREN